MSKHTNKIKSNVEISLKAVEKHLMNKNISKMYTTRMVHADRHNRQTIR